ncbi:hypothetical protein IWX90DRAFT_417601 [Phyllosticta citrichinensis]|uniref:Uncharacterized protein n=1 Tax=Phyllosticta citrichinensis TaxID=1130410 RepID=A0ABR1XLJ7_9PEZI
MSPIPLPLPLALPFPQQTASPQPNEADIEPASGSGLGSSASSAPKSDDGAVKAALFAVGIVLVLALLIYLFCTVDPPAAWLRRLTGRSGDGGQAAKDNNNNNNSDGRRRGARLDSLASSPLPLPATPPLPPPEHGIRLTNGYSIRREERVGGNTDGGEKKPAAACGVGIYGNGHHAFQFGFDASPPSRSATPQNEFAGSGREGVRGAPAPPPPPPRAKAGAGQFSLMAAPGAAGHKALGAAQV